MFEGYELRDINLPQLCACRAHDLLQASCSSMASTDRDTLVALFRSTDGANWTLNSGWDTDADLSQWYGVKVNDEGRVVRLSLGGNNLRGT